MFLRLENGHVACGRAKRRQMVALKIFSAEFHSGKSLAAALASSPLCKQALLAFFLISFRTKSLCACVLSLISRYRDVGRLRRERHVAAT